MFFLVLALRRLELSVGSVAANPADEHAVEPLDFFLEELEFFLNRRVRASVVAPQVLLRSRGSIAAKRVGEPTVRRLHNFFSKDRRLAG